MKFAVLIPLLWVNFAFAFPEMVRHGYTQCTACHVSPAGGGLLTRYGRQLSSELLSTWSYKGESNFLYLPEAKSWAEKGFLFGGDVRGIETHYKDPTTEQSKGFLMMANVQGAYETGKFIGVVSIGQVKEPMEHGVRLNGDATEYYGMLKMTDELAVRAGRFQPSYGLNLPDHTTVIKEMIGFVPEFQFDSVEGSYLSDHWTVLAAVGKTTSSADDTIQENVGSANVSYALTDSMRAGVSYWNGSGVQVERRIYGVNGILGFTKKLYSLVEFDVENSRRPSQQTGEYGLGQLGYELFQGLTPYFQYQHEHENRADAETLTRTYGVGAHFYPRPHFEFTGQWDRVHSFGLWSDEAYLMAHYYF